MRAFTSRLGVAAACALLATGLGSERDASAAGASCNRACLEHQVDSYFAALVAHDPGKLPLAPDVKFVENTVPMHPGEGLWKTASAAPTTFKIYVPDPTAQQVGFIGVMQESGKPVEIALRLKLSGGKITEIEHLVARNLRESSLANLETPRPGLLAKVPPAERSTRDQLLKIGASYYDALVGANGSAAPFADDCARRENGMQTSSNKSPPKETPISNAGASSSSMTKLGALGCAAQLNTHVFDYIKRIEPRRVWIADVETGLVFGLSQFRQPMEEKSVKIVGVEGIDSVPMNFKPFDLPAAHIFKVRDGKIHEIEAMGTLMPYDSKTGWE
jgi:hypothetical protein